jgi:hypothetical protein
MSNDIGSHDPQSPGLPNPPWARRQGQEQDLDTTENGQQQEPEPKGEGSVRESLHPSANKFHLGNGADGKHYWLTPPDLLNDLYARYEITFDPCPYPKPDDFDGLTCEWGESNYVNPPFGSIIHEGKKKGPTAWARKAIAEAAAGKRVVLVYPIDKWVLMLLAAGARVRNLGDVRWLATEDGSAGKGTGRHIAEFVLEGGPDSRAGAPVLVVDPDEALTPPSVSPPSAETTRCPTCRGDGSETWPLDGNCPAEWAHQHLSRFPTPAPAGEAMSEERLAQIRRISEASWTSLGDLARELLAEIDRTREDARLGAALREVLATLRNDDRLTIDKFFDGCEVRMALCGCADLPEETDATRALAALLAASPRRSPDEGMR